MKTFNASDLSKKPSQVWVSAREGGAIIQHKDRSGKNVIEEFIITKYIKPPKQRYEYNAVKGLSQSILNKSLIE